LSVVAVFVILSVPSHFGQLVPISYPMCQCRAGSDLWRFMAQGGHCQALPLLFSQLPSHQGAT